MAELPVEVILADLLDDVVDCVKDIEHDSLGLHLCVPFLLLLLFVSPAQADVVLYLQLEVTLLLGLIFTINGALKRLDCRLKLGITLSFFSLQVGLLRSWGHFTSFHLAIILFYFHV